LPDIRFPDIPTVKGTTRWCVTFSFCFLRDAPLFGPALSMLETGSGMTSFAVLCVVSSLNSLLYNGLDDIKGAKRSKSTGLASSCGIFSCFMNYLSSVLTYSHLTFYHGLLG
jgi:hypothetical protein